jgi:hypothetical protein
MAYPSGKGSLLAVLGATRAAVYPEGVHDAAFRLAFEQEAQESNARLVRWVVLAAVPLNVVFTVVLLRRPPEDSVGAAWTFWLVILNMLLGTLGLVAAIVSWYQRPGALWRLLGDLMGSVWILGGAARSANTQRVHPNLMFFVVVMFAAVFFVRMRPKVFASAVLGAVALLLASIVHFVSVRPLASWRVSLQLRKLFPRCGSSMTGSSLKNAWERQTTRDPLGSVVLRALVARGAVQRGAHRTWGPRVVRVRRGLVD